MNIDLDDFLDTKPEKKNPAKKVEPKEEKKSNNFSDLDSYVESVKKDIKAQVEKEIYDQVNDLKITIDDGVDKALKQLVEGRIEETASAIIKSVKEQLQLTSHVIEVPKLNTSVITDMPVHECFDEMAMYLMGHQNVYLYGQAGTGKTFMAEQFAKLMKLPFYNLTQGDFIGIFGYTDLNGKFHDTPFTLWCKNGGVLYSSEFDATDATIALSFNTAIANGITTINGQTVKLNENCYFIADGNTAGNGADFNYAGRNKLDASTINRFSFIEVGYDRNIEMFLSHNDVELVDFIDDFRKACKKCDSAILTTYRAIQGISKFKNSNIPLWKVLNSQLIKGAEYSELETILSNMKDKNSKYVANIRELIEKQKEASRGN